MDRRCSLLYPEGKKGEKNKPLVSFALVPFQGNRIIRGIAPATGSGTKAGRSQIIEG
jgi:hypothetical protein